MFFFKYDKSYLCQKYKKVRFLYSTHATTMYTTHLQTPSNTPRYLNHIHPPHPPPPHALTHTHEDTHATSNIVEEK